MFEASFRGCFHTVREDRDAWLRSGMEVGINDGYGAIDALLADGVL